MIKESCKFIDPVKNDYNLNCVRFAMKYIMLDKVLLALLTKDEEKEI